MEASKSLEEVVVDGVGLHSGVPARVILRRWPGPVCLRSGDAVARVDELTVASSARATTVAAGSLRVGTVEHAFAALAGLGIRHGLLIDVSGPELPLLDGGATAWCAALQRLDLPASGPVLHVTRPATYDVGSSRFELAPTDDGSVDVTACIDFDDPRLVSEARWRGDRDDFLARIAPARTFAFAHEVDELARRDLARHVDPASVVVIAPDALLHAGRPLSPDEPARHKLLDLLGDFYLFGGPAVGRLRATRPGHAANAQAFRRALEEGVLARLSTALFAFLLLAFLLVPIEARAQQTGQPLAFEDPYAVPRAPRAPTLRELTHSEIEATLETTAGAIYLPAGQGLQHAYVQRLDVEIPVALRRWYVGASYEVAGANNGTGFSVVGGNLAVDGRTVWATTTGLAYGGGMALMVPTASYDPNGPASKVALAAATLRPWDVSYFVPDSYGVRPYVDVRAHDGPFVVQFRQGLDLTVSSLLLSDRRLYATAGLYLGWQIAPAVAAGFEAFEAYAISLASVRDGNRESVVISPNVRLSLPWVQPAISAFTNLGPPISAPWVQRDTSVFTVPGNTATVWGFRVAFTVTYDPSSSVMLKGR